MFLVGAVFTEFSLLEGSRARISANRSACFCDFAVVLPSATFPCKPLNFRLFLFCIDLFWGFFLITRGYRASDLFIFITFQSEEFKFIPHPPGLRHTRAHCVRVFVNTLFPMKELGEREV